MDIKELLEEMKAMDEKFRNRLATPPLTDLSESARAHIASWGGRIEQEQQSPFGGYQYHITFPNKWGLSIIKTPGVSYGIQEDLWEAAVLDELGDLCYTTDITDDVLGYQNEHDILVLCNRLSAGDFKKPSDYVGKHERRVG